jgi:hypothetical protein
MAARITAWMLHCNLTRAGTTFVETTNEWTSNHAGGTDQR